MRTQFLAFTLLAALAASDSMAAQPAVTADVAQFVSSDQIKAMMDKAKAERNPDQANYVQPIAQLAPYRAMLEYRMLRASPTQHKADAELMYVISGTGTAVTGGTLRNALQTNDYNFVGSDIAGGKSQALKPGDVLFVPQNTPHQLIPDQAPLVLMTFHVPRPVTWPGR